MMVTGRQSLRTTTNFPYAGGDDVTLDTKDIRALGKLTAWGSSCVQFVARLADDSLVHVRACDQAPEVQKWIRATTKDLRAQNPDRLVGWAIAWKELV